MIPVTVSGTITDNLSGVNPSSAAFAVHDEYGLVQPSGPVTLGTRRKLLVRGLTAGVTRWQRPGRAAVHDHRQRQ